MERSRWSWVVVALALYACACDVNADVAATQPSGQSADAKVSRDDVTLDPALVELTNQLVSCRSWTHEGPSPLCNPMMALGHYVEQLDGEHVTATLTFLATDKEDSRKRWVAARVLKEKAKAGTGVLQLDELIDLVGAEDDPSIENMHLATIAMYASVDSQDLGVILSVLRDASRACGACEPAMDHWKDAASRAGARSHGRMLELLASDASSDFELAVHGLRASLRDEMATGRLARQILESYLSEEDEGRRRQLSTLRLDVDVDEGTRGDVYAELSAQAASPDPPLSAWCDGVEPSPQRRSKLTDLAQNARSWEVRLEALTCASAYATEAERGSDCPMWLEFFENADASVRHHALLKIIHVEDDEWGTKEPEAACPVQFPRTLRTLERRAREGTLSEGHDVYDVLAMLRRSMSPIKKHTPTSKALAKAETLSPKLTALAKSIASNPKNVTKARLDALRFVSPNRSYPKRSPSLAKSLLKDPDEEVRAEASDIVERKYSKPRRR